MARDDYGDSFYTYNRKRNNEEENDLIDIPLDDEYYEEDDFDFITYEEEYDENLPQEKPFDNYEKNIKSGEFEVKEFKERYVSTFLFFPLSLLYLEVIFKIACKLNFFDGIIYFFAFPLAFGTLLTLICTMSKKARKNRTIAKIILAIITICYEAQMIYYMVYNTMIDIDAVKNLSSDFVADFIIKGHIFKTTQFIVCFVLILLPFILLMIMGKRFFPFVRTPFISKGLLIGVIVLISVLIVLIIKSTKAVATTDADYKVMISEDQNKRTEKFGLLASQGMDIYNETSKIIKNNAKK